MVSRTTLLLLWVVIVMVGAALQPQTPIEPMKPCIYADCGVTDVTPFLNESLNDNPQKYRILSKINGSIYIGGLQELIKIDPSCEGDETDPWMQRSRQIPSCLGGEMGGLACSSLASNTNPTLICDNYIRVVEAVDDKLLVCGTSSAFPRCYAFDNTCDLTVANNGQLNGGNCLTEDSYQGHDPFNLAPRNWDQNTSLAYFGNELFIGSTPAISVDNAFVGKLDVIGTIGNYGSDIYDDDLDTYTIESRSVNEANFVGHPYKYSNGSDFILFFFRETAVEHINQGKIVYSRVARVCQDDTGNTGKWSSYLKARLNCSRPGLYPEYLDEIQDVSVSTISGKVYFYAVFTQPPNAPPQSAVCVFSLEEIHEVFQESKFKAPQSANSLWLPVNTGEPAPRPGFDCSSPSSDTTFLQNTPLMNDLVKNYNYIPERQEAEEADASDFPLFFHNGARFSRIVVDSRGGSSFTDAVIFIGTETGEIWKVTDPSTSSAADEDFHIITLWQSATGSPITGLGLIETGGKSYLYATTNEQIIKIDLQFGKAQTKAQFNEIYPPYLELPADFQASNVMIPHHVNVSICDNREVLILCEGNLDPTLNMTANATWQFNGDNLDAMTELESTQLGHLIKYEIPRSDVADPLSYIVITTHNRTSGEYTCVVSMGDETEQSETSTVNVENCITTQAVEDRMAAHSQAEMKDDTIQMAYKEEGICSVDPVSCDDSCPWTFSP